MIMIETKYEFNISFHLTVVMISSSIHNFLHIKIWMYTKYELNIYLHLIVAMISSLVHNF